jgi:uncharacterized protein (TIGR00730 family)
MPTSLDEIIKKIHNKEYRDRLDRMTREIAEGFDFLENFDNDRVVTVYGSTRIKRGSPVYNKARALGRMLAEDGITVVTGGGPGIMEAANHGAYEVGGRSVGININLVTQERKNAYTNENINFDYFFARKLILAHIAQAYIYFPGGFGTLDEFFEITTLISTEKIEKKIPVVMIDTGYWQTLYKWLERVGVKKYKTLTPDNLAIWTITNSVTEAFELVRKIPRRIKRTQRV